MNGIGFYKLSFYRLGRTISCCSRLTTTTTTTTRRQGGTRRRRRRSIPLLILLQQQQQVQSLNQLYQIHALFITSGLFYLQHSPFGFHPSTRILKLSSDFDNLDYSISIFRQIQSPESDSFCINTLIKAYSNSSSLNPHPHQPLSFYFHMLHHTSFIPNNYTFPPLFSCCSKLPKHHHFQAFKCHAHSIKFGGFHTLLPVHNSLIHMYASFGLIHSASHLFDTMSPHHRDLVSWNSILNAYVQVRDFTLAHHIFDEIPLPKNVITWNILISGYLKGGNPGCSLKLFRHMVQQLHGCFTTDTTIVTILTACARSARLKEGRSVHASFLKNTHHKSSFILHTALIDMYSKCQRVHVARRVFDRICVKERNLVCWNAMILGHCIHGSPQDGISLFTTMLMLMGTTKTDHSLLAPDEVTFVGLLCACARAGLLAEGRNYFNQMSSVYGIQPKFAHHWCMANLYYGAGLVQDAEQVLRSIPAGDDEDDDGSSSESLVLSTLLGSCRFLGGSDLGERTAFRLIELEPQNASRYNLLLNVYAVAGRWEEVGKVKEIMKDKGFKSTPGCSLVHLNEVVHEFAVEDNSLPRKQQVYNRMNELARELRLQPIRTGLQHPTPTGK